MKTTTTTISLLLLLAVQSQVFAWKVAITNATTSLLTFRIYKNGTLLTSTGIGANGSTLKDIGTGTSLSNNDVITVDRADTGALLFRTDDGTTGFTVKATPTIDLTTGVIPGPNAQNNVTAWFQNGAAPPVTRKIGVRVQNKTPFAETYKITLSTDSLGSFLTDTDGSGIVIQPGHTGYYYSTSVDTAHQGAAHITCPDGPSDLTYTVAACCGSAFWSNPDSAPCNICSGPDLDAITIIDTVDGSADFTTANGPINFTKGANSPNVATDETIQEGFNALYASEQEANKGILQKLTTANSKSDTINSTLGNLAVINTTLQGTDSRVQANGTALSSIDTKTTTQLSKLDTLNTSVGTVKTSADAVTAAVNNSATANSANFSSLITAVNNVNTSVNAAGTTAHSDNTAQLGEMQTQTGLLRAVTNALGNGSAVAGETTTTIQTRLNSVYSDGINAGGNLMSGIHDLANSLGGFDAGSADDVDPEFWKITLPVYHRPGGLHALAVAGDVISLNPLADPMMQELALWVRGAIIWVMLATYIGFAWDRSENWCKYVMVVPSTSSGGGTLKLISDVPILGDFTFAAKLGLMMTVVATIPVAFLAFVSSGSFLSHLLINPLSSEVSFIRQGLAMVDRFFPIFMCFGTVVAALVYRFSSGVVGMTAMVAYKFVASA